MVAATRHFSRKHDEIVNESMIRTIPKAYEREVSINGGEAMNHLPEKKRWRSVLLGADIDARVQAYLKRVREGGDAVSARIAIAVAKGLLLCYDKSPLAEFGGPVVLNKDWAYSLLKRMKSVKRKATTSKSKYTITNFEIFFG